MGFKALTFFDQKAVKDSTDRTNRKALSLLGAFVRQHAKRSMRRRKGPSPKGTPPSKHERPWLEKLLFFAWDQGTRSVVVGPAPFGRGDGAWLNERGGAAAIRLPNGRTVRGVYDKRPYMAPALAAVWPRLGACYAAAGA